MAPRYVDAGEALRYYLRADDTIYNVVRPAEADPHRFKARIWAFDDMTPEKESSVADDVGTVIISSSGGAAGVGGGMIPLEWHFITIQCTGQSESRAHRLHRLVWQRLQDLEFGSAYSPPLPTQATNGDPYLDIFGFEWDRANDGSFSRDVNGDTVDFPKWTLFSVERSVGTQTTRWPGGKGYQVFAGYRLTYRGDDDAGEGID